MMKVNTNEFEQHIKSARRALSSRCIKKNENQNICLLYYGYSLSPGKRLRGELLVQLKDRAGLKYKEIAEMDIFTRLSFTSLGGIYRNIKKAHLKKAE